MKRLLFITHRMPYPPDKGERVRAFHELQALAQHFEITLASLAYEASDLESAQMLRCWCSQVLLVGRSAWAGRLRAGLSLLTGRAASEGYFASRSLAQAIARSGKGQPFDVVLGYCSSMLPYALRAPARQRLIDLVDVDSAKWAAYAGQSSGLRKWLYGREARLVARLERQSVRECRAVFLVSQNEIDALGIRSERLIALPNGVDTEFFSPQAPSDPPSAEIVFTGSMDYRPNVEAVCWFARSVLPAVRKRVGGASFWIVGRNPTRAVQRLAEEVPAVHVTGAVPDVRPFLARAQIAVAPLHIARGIQNKVLEAMAMGKPVIVSPQAAEGIEAAPDVELLLARTVQEWEDQVVLLLGSSGRCAELGALARQCVRERYSWPARMAPLVDLCLRLAEESA